MQAEHHLGKAQARVLDRDPKVTGKRNLEPAAQAIAVNDGNRGHRQVIEPVDDRVPLGEARLDVGHVGHAAKFADVGAGDEPAGLPRAQHHAFRLLALQGREHVVELGENLLGQDVGAAARLVEHEPGDAVVIARELPVPPVALPARRSGKRTELQIARRQNVPDLAHLVHTTLRVCFDDVSADSVNSLSHRERGGVRG